MGNKQGRGARTKKKKERAAKRLAKKRAMTALYQSWAQAGITKGSRRSKAKADARRTVKDHKHPNGRCWNVGCRECFPGGPLHPGANMRWHNNEAKS